MRSIKQWRRKFDSGLWHIFRWPYIVWTERYVRYGILKFVRYRTMPCGGRLRLRRVFLILGQRVCGYVLEKVRYGKSVEIAKVPCEVLFECCLLRVIGISDCMPGLQYCSLRSPLPRTIAHTGLCGGEGKCTHQAHEMIQLATKWLVLCNPDPGGVAVSSCQIRIELIYLQSDDSRPGDLYAMPGGHHAKDAAMDIMISSTRSQSCLQQSSTSSDYALRKTKNK